MTDFLDKFEGYKFENLGYIRIPKFNPPEKDLVKFGLKKDCDSSSYLRALVADGFDQKEAAGLIPKERKQDYMERAESELAMLETLGFIDYLLLIHSITDFCQTNAILQGFSRGCLSGESKVITDKGLVNLKDVRVGDEVINSQGETDAVTNSFEYDCEETLVSFKTFCPTHTEIAMTGDHRVLMLKNVFKRVKAGEIERLKNYDLKTIFRNDKLEWEAAKNIRPNDYLVRYVGRTAPVSDIRTIDLAEHCPEFDEGFVYEKHAINQKHDLSLNGIGEKTGLSNNCLLNIKRGGNYKKACKERLVQYLSEKEFVFEDFIKFVSFTTKKYCRFLSLDDEFCYILGFFIGDGWHRDFQIGFAFHSEDNLEQLERVKKYFRQFGLEGTAIKHKKTKLIQFDRFDYSEREFSPNTGTYKLYRHDAPDDYKW